MPSNLSGEPFALLAAFRALSSNDVYTMAPKEAVVRGFDYARQQRLQRYLWNQDHTTLIAQVQGIRLYAVAFSLDEGFLTTSCDCPAWDPRRLCKHVLCACFTTKHLLSPEAFRMPEWQPSRAQALRTELFGDLPATRESARPAPAGSARSEAVRTDPRYEIVLDIRQGHPQIVIQRNGVPLAPSWAPVLPPELVPLFNASRFLSGFGEDPLRRYLRLRERRYPIVLESGRGSMSLEWCPAVKCRSRTEIDLVGGRVRIRALCLADGVPLERMARVRSFVVDLDGGRLLYLEDERGWASFRSLRQCFLDHDPQADRLNRELRAVTLPGGTWAGRWTGINREMEFTVSQDDFEAAQVDLPQGRADRILRDLRLKLEGIEAPVQRPAPPSKGDAPSYALILKPPSGAKGSPSTVWTLVIRSRLGETRCAPSQSTFGFIPALEQGRGISGSLRAQKRKAVLYETFFHLRAVRTAKERDQRVKTVLALEGWTRAVKEEGARWLRAQLAAYARPDVRLQIRAGRWELQPIDKAREALLYSIPLEVFGPEAFRGMRRVDELTLDAAALFRRLPELLDRLMAAGIEMLYEDKPLRTARWECAVQVERGERDGTGIDWFEIRPEIRCDGLTLNETEWRAALLQGGLIDSERGLRVLDRQTLERLRAILDLTGEEQAGREPSKIVRVPRLQMLDWLALREQGITVTLPPEDEAVLARLLGFTRIAAKPLPKELHATLRPYQEEGYAWLAFLYEHRFGACLADDMGLGKTLQAICLLAAIQEGRIKGARGVPGPHLVVVPTSLLFNWEQELARFAPGLNVHTYSGSERTLDAKDGEVVLTTYGLVRRDIEQLERMPFHVIVFDEAQAVKNILADTTSAVRRLRGRFTLALSGTPLENHLGEYFSVIDLCLPGLLGDYDKFKPQLKRAEGPLLERLLRRTRPFILRRTKPEILHDLPPKIESEVFLDLTDRQKALYQQTVAQVRSTIDEAYATKSPGQAQFIALTAILKLRQVCLSPRLLTKQDNESSPKLSFLVERLQVLLEEGHSALVFSQFTSFLDLVQEACVRHGLPYQRLDGSTAAAARKDRVAAFQGGERPSVFLLSLKAGGQGLNLTKATYVFHLDPWWNPAVENQASDRAHRIGQQRTVSIVRILMRHSIEEKMMALKQRKLDLYAAVMAGAVRGSGQGLLTKADFDFLLSPGAG
ncbi:SNF2-related protein [Nitrospira sp. NS4]|uniref:SNF2-related protein n=1 Tax=Nitrospira sp. NS4 TaxID=3414498 RepID=UPI003C305871